MNSRSLAFLLFLALTPLVVAGQGTAVRADTAAATLPPFTPHILLLPTHRVDRLKGLVSSSPRVAITLTLKVRQNGQVVHRQVKHGTTNTQGAYRFVMQLKWRPPKPLPASLTAVAHNAAGTTSSTLRFTVFPTSASERFHR